MKKARLELIKVSNVLKIVEKVAEVRESVKIVEIKEETTIKKVPTKNYKLFVMTRGTDCASLGSVQ